MQLSLVFLRNYSAKKMISMLREREIPRHSHRKIEDILYKQMFYDQHMNSFIQLSPVNYMV
jgi:hypothetical protein